MKTEFNNQTEGGIGMEKTKTEVELSQNETEVSFLPAFDLHSLFFRL